MPVYKLTAIQSENFKLQVLKNELPVDFILTLVFTMYQPFKKNQHRRDILDICFR